MNKEIEEMALEMPEKIKDPLDNSRYIIFGKSLRREIAKIYYNAGYRKIDENCAVITKAELKEYKRQAVKEFSEKLKKKVHNYYPSIDSYCMSRHVILVQDIDELLKEILK